MEFDDPDLLSLADAAKALPANMAPSTISRWATRGQRGIQLETLRIGGRVYTSRKALPDFFDSVSACVVNRPRPNCRQPNLLTVDDELRKRGFRMNFLIALSESGEDALRGHVNIEVNCRVGSAREHEGRFRPAASELGRPA